MPARRSRRCVARNPVKGRRRAVESVENTGRWTREEHYLFLAALKEHGRDWKEVAARVPSRSVVQCRTHAQKWFLRQEKCLPDELDGSGPEVDGGEDDDEKLPAVVIPDTPVAVSGQRCSSRSRTPAPVHSDSRVPKKLKLSLICRPPTTQPPLTPTACAPQNLKLPILSSINLQVLANSLLATQLDEEGNCNTDAHQADSSSVWSDNSHSFMGDDADALLLDLLASDPGTDGDASFDSDTSSDVDDLEPEPLDQWGNARDMSSGEQTDSEDMDDEGLYGIMEDTFLPADVGEIFQLGFAGC